MIWRIVLCGRFNETYKNVAWHWSVPEVLTACEIIDAIDEASKPKPTYKLPG